MHMATADQMKSLVRAYIEHDDARFKTIVLQIAAHEAKLGHDAVARELKTQIDKLGKRVARIVQLTPQNPMLHYPNMIYQSSLFRTKCPKRFNAF